MDVGSRIQRIILTVEDNPSRGSGLENPIEINDEVEILGFVEWNRGRNRQNPIVVEQDGPWISCFPRHRRPVIEIGETSGISELNKLETAFGNSSSSHVRLEPNCNCEICAESKYPFELFSIKGCSHTYCKSCVGQYIAAKVEENSLFIKCPDPNCSEGNLDPATCSPILERRVFNLWCKALCELTLSDKFYCPFTDCAALMIHDEKEITDAECPHCSRLFCAQCKVPWHEGFSCTDFQKLGEDERNKEDLMLVKLAKENKWQRCPKCLFFVERIAGCMFMTCRCGFTFCYGCATEMKTNHYCEVCRR